MEGKKMGESAITMTQLMIPSDANPAGNVHGGIIMKLIDNAAGAVAARHARSNVVTASVDRLDFHNPVFIGELVTLRAAANMVGRTSMEVGVRVESENLITGVVRHTVSAYLTMVALDGNGRPKELPPLIIESDIETRRNREAIARRQMRLQERKKEAACQEGVNT
jgi:uncharacterized protein (TIGR00369 family)